MIARGASSHLRHPIYNMARNRGHKRNMQTSSSTGNDQQDGSSSTNAPWRKQPSQFNGTQQNKQQVDSWRSYRNDQTNLQTATSWRPGYNPTAVPFAPASLPHPQPQFSSYQPLRYSNVASNKRTFRNGEQFYSTGSNTYRQGYTLSTNEITRGPNDAFSETPLPSIEVDNSNILPPRNLDTIRGFTSRRSSPRRTVPPPVAPEASQLYKDQASKPTVALASPRKLLVILDLNGTLLFRPSRSANPTAINMRPGVTNLLEYLFEHHIVMIYTSAQPANATGIVNNLIPPLQRRRLAAIWARDKLDLTQAQYREKVQVYKKLDKVWNDPSIQATAEPGCRWDQTNTILVDDSRLKALAQPHNLLQVTEYMKNDNPSSAAFKTPEARARASKIQQDILKQLELKLEELKWQEDVSRMIRLWQTGQATVPRVPGQEVVVEETVDQKETQPQKDNEITHLPTPKSPSAEDDNVEEADMDLSNSDNEEEPDLVSTIPISPAASATDVDPSVQELTEKIPALGQMNDTPHEGYIDPSATARRSVSPIDPSVWKDLLGGNDSSGKGIVTSEEQKYSRPR